MMRVLDNKGEICVLACIGTWSRKKFTDNRVSIKWMLILPDSLMYMVWLPVFTDWWEDDDGLD